MAWLSFFYFLLRGTLPSDPLSQVVYKFWFITTVDYDIMREVGTTYFYPNDIKCPRLSTSHCAQLRA